MFSFVVYDIIYFYKTFLLDKFEMNVMMNIFKIERVEVFRDYLLVF